MGRDVLLIATSRIIAVLVMLATSICISRTLGPEGQGTYFLGMTFCATVIQLSNLGLHNSQVHQLVEDRGSLPSLIGNILMASTVVVGASSAAMLAMWFLFGWANQETFWPLVFGAAIVPARMFFTLGSSPLIALNQVQAFNRYLLVSNILVFVATAIVSLWRPGVLTYLAGTLCGTALCSLLLYRNLRSHCATSVRLNLAMIRSAAKIGFRAYVVCLLTFLVTRLNVFLLEQISGAESVGQYSIAMQIMDVLLLIPSSLNLLLFPRLVQQPDQRSQLTWRSVGIISLLMAAGTLTTLLFAGPVINVLYGAEFANAGKIVVPIMPAIICSALVNIIQPYFASKGFPKFMIGYWSLGLAVLMVSSFFLIPKYAEQGAGWSLSAAYASIFVAFAAKFIRSELALHKLRGGSERAPSQSQESSADVLADAA